MAHASSNDLAEARRALDEALRANHAQLRRARRCSDVRARHWDISGRMRNASVAMYQLSGVADPAVEYLAACGRERHWEAMSKEFLATRAEDMWLETGVDGVVAAVDEELTPDPAGLALGHKYVLEWRVASWARGVNEVKGLPVSSQAMLVQREKYREEIPFSTRPGPIGSTRERRAQNFLARVRRRWGGRYAAVPASDRQGPAETGRKAPL